MKNGYLKAMLDDRVYTRAQTVLGRPLKNYELMRFHNQERANVQRILTKAQTEIDKRVDKYVKSLRD